MKGRFEVSLLRTGNLKDEDFVFAQKESRIDKLLRGLEREVHCPKQHNLVNDNFAAYMFEHIMSGGSVSNAYSRGTAGYNGLASINLQTTDSEPSYTESSDQSTTLHLVGSPANSTSGGKRFIEDDTEDERIIVWGDAFENQGVLIDKESLMFRSRWLYQPLQAVTASDAPIRSIAYFFAEDADITTGSYRGILGRVRLKDSDGNNIFIHKSDKHVLLVELELEMVTV